MHRKRPSLTAASSKCLRKSIKQDELVGTAYSPRPQLCVAWELPTPEAIPLDFLLLLCMLIPRPGDTVRQQTICEQAQGTTLKHNMIW